MGHGNCVHQAQFEVMLTCTRSAWKIGENVISCTVNWLLWMYLFVSALPFFTFISFMILPHVVFYAISLFFFRLESVPQIGFLWSVILASLSNTI